MPPVETLDQSNEMPTLGELFPDGTALDRLRNNQLVLWREGQEEIASGHRYNGNYYMAAALDPKLEELLRLPAGNPGLRKCRESVCRLVPFGWQFRGTG